MPAQNLQCCTWHVEAMARDALVRFSRADRGIGSDRLVCLLLLLLLGTLKSADGAAASEGLRTGDVGYGAAVCDIIAGYGPSPAYMLTA